MPIPDFERPVRGIGMLIFRSGAFPQIRKPRPMRKETRGLERTEESSMKTGDGNGRPVPEPPRITSSRMCALTINIWKSRGFHA